MSSLWTWDVHLLSLPHFYSSSEGGLRGAALRAAFFVAWAHGATCRPLPSALLSSLILPNPGPPLLPPLGGVLLKPSQRYACHVGSNRVSLLLKNHFLCQQAKGKPVSMELSSVSYGSMKRHSVDG